MPVSLPVPRRRRALASAPAEAPRIEYRTIHGYRRAFVRAGSGPALLLVHGICDSSDTWRELIPVLARNHTVIAPDLLGHGRSEKPRADYSVGAYANGMRDLLSVLEIERATVVGHSLGGGVTMQFAYQFPERCERLVLVSSGGVGREVSPWLRAMTLPTSELVFQLTRLPGSRLTTRLALEAMRRTGTGVGHDAPEMMRLFDSLPDATSRSAFVRTLRAVVDSRGQVVTMLDRAYLAAALPLLLVWGTDDGVVPVEHAHIAHGAMPDSRLELFEGAGHFPHKDDPARFLRLLQDFMATTEPAAVEPEEWRALLRRGRPGEQDEVEAVITEETIAASVRSAT